MSESTFDENSETRGEEAARRAARREEARRRWMEKRQAEEHARPPQRELSPVEKLLDVALTPTYVALGAGIIIYRILRGLPPVSDEDYDDD